MTTRVPRRLDRPVLSSLFWLTMPLELTPGVLVRVVGHPSWSVFHGSPPEPVVLGPSVHIFLPGEPFEDCLTFPDFSDWPEPS